MINFLSPFLLLAQAGGALDLVKLIPDGAGVVSVIVVVVLFLKQQEKFNKILQDITTDFHGQIKENQKAFQDQIRDLSVNYFTNQKAYQDQIQRLMDVHIQVTRDMIAALGEMKRTVDTVVQRIQQLEGPDKK